ncbi:MAG: hypothetical protein J6N72_02400 [Psychrobacter sp.]|nr:hypothetical protein [Psychrobacter sp.]
MSRRQSTKQWELTSHVRLPSILNMECRYPSKIKPLTYVYLVMGIPWELGEIIHAVQHDKSSQPQKQKKLYPASSILTTENSVMRQGNGLVWL